MYRDYIGILLGVYRSCIGVILGYMGIILGLYTGCIRIIELSVGQEPRTCQWPRALSGWQGNVSSFVTSLHFACA